MAEQSLQVAGTRLSKSGSTRNFSVSFLFAFFLEIMEKQIYPFHPQQLPGRRELYIQDNYKFPGKARITSKLTKEGVQICERLSGDGSRSETIPSHHYSASSTFGYFLPQNDINPSMSRRFPAYETTAEDYGRHYRHPRQEYTRVLNLRSPSFNSDVSKSNLERFRVETKLMSD